MGFETVDCEAESKLMCLYGKHLSFQLYQDEKM